MYRSSRICFFSGSGLFCAAAAWLLFGQTSALAQQSVEHYSARPLGHCVRVAEAPAVDGDLSDPAYTAAQPLTYFNSRFLRLPVSQQTEARLVWTSEGLFAAIRCFEADMEQVISIATERDGAVERDNSIALTLVPSDRLSDYVEFAVNTLGTVSDERAGNKEWNTEWKAAVGTFQDGWTAEIFVPWSSTDRSPAIGEAWGLGIARVEGPHAEYSNWAVVDGQYDRRDRHGQIVFTDRENLPYLTLEYPERLVMGYNRVAGTLVGRGFSDARYVVRVQRWEQSRDSLLREVELVERSLTADSPSFEFETNVENPGTYLLSFSLGDGTKILSRSTLGYRVHAVEGERFALESKQPIYTWEDEARFYLSIDPTVANFKEMQILTEVFTTTGRIVQKQEDPLVTSHQIIRLSLTDLIDGTYYADISLMGPGGLITSWTITFDKNSSDPPPSVSARSDGMLLVGEEPVFPLGMFEVPDIAELSEAGFNVVIGRDAPDFTREREMVLYLDRCQDLGLYAVLSVGPYVMPELERDTLREAVCYVKDHPALLGYLVLQRPSESGIEPAYLDTIRAIIRDVDPFHPTLITEETQVMFPGYADMSDVFVPVWFSVPFGSLAATGDVLQRALQAKSEDGSVMVCLQAFGRPTLRRRHPTLKESRVMAWMALIHETKGLCWWSCEESKRAGHWGDLKRIAGDLDPIIPFILSGTPGEIDRSESSPGVCMRSWLRGQETLVLIANAEAKARSIPLPGTWTSIRSLLGERPSLEAPGGAESPRIVLEPYGVEALILQTGRP